MSSNTTVHKHQTGSGYTFQQKSEMLSILLREQIITNEHQQYQQIRQILKDLKQSNILSFDVQLGQKINSNINKKELKKI